MLPIRSVCLAHPRRFSHLTIAALMAVGCSAEIPASDDRSDTVGSGVAAPSNVFKLSLRLGAKTGQRPIVVEVKDSTQKITREFFGDAAEEVIALPDTATAITLQLPTHLALAYWQGPCVRETDSLNSGNVTCVIDLPTAGQRNQVFQARIAPRSYRGWQLDWVQGPAVLGQNQAPTLSAVAINNRGDIAVAGKIRQNTAPFVLIGRNDSSAPQEKKWSYLLATEAEISPAAVVKTLDLPEEKAAQESDCAALAFMAINASENTAGCITAGGGFQKFALPPSAASVDSYAYAPNFVSKTLQGSPVVVPRVVLTSGSSVYYASPIQLTNWNHIPAPADFPPRAFVSASADSKTVWAASSWWPIVKFDGVWKSFYFKALENERQLQVVAVRGGAWVLTDSKKMFYISSADDTATERTTSTCGLITSIAANEDGRVLAAGSGGICEWNDAKQNWELMLSGFGEDHPYPAKIVFSPDGKRVAAISGNMVMSIN